jgi:hypothetical protein
LRDSNPLKSSVQPYRRKQMAISKVDKSDEFKKSGMTLISETSSDYLLKKSRKAKYAIPEDRLSRPCGGVNGFDDFVERFEE